MAFHLGRIDSADTRRADASGTKQGKKVASAGARRAKAARLVVSRRGAVVGGDDQGEVSAEAGACGLKASAQKKRVRGDGAFGGADFVVRIERGEAESGVFEGGAVCAAR